MKYRKKPVVIDAVQWSGQNLEEVMNFITNGTGTFDHLPTTGGQIKPGVGHTPADGRLYIPTLEGDMAASPMDWIIKGVKGEFYPCKPDIFEATYEPVFEPEPEDV